jgi:protein-S-isoprenylcysteine O-methyltransferase Ste14
MLLLNVHYWFINPFSLQQIISWIFLIISILLASQGFYFLLKHGGRKERKNEPANFKFENTVYLVKNGIYKYIRHPMYSSLLFLCLGVFTKNISTYTIISMAVALLFLIFTAKTEEKEDVKFFGSSYLEYIKVTKMFVPFIL